MPLRQPVNDTPEAIRAGVLFGLWCGLMATLLGCLYLEHLLPPAARVACWLVGILGMMGGVLFAEIYKRRGGHWAPDGWLGGFFLAGMVLVVLVGIEFVVMFSNDGDPDDQVTLSTQGDTNDR